MNRIHDLLQLVSQQELASSLGVDPSYLSLVLNGHRPPSARLLAGLRDELNRHIVLIRPVTIDELAEYLDWGMVAHTLDAVSA